MSKFTEISYSIAITASFIGAAPAGAQTGTPVYRETYYSDASLQTPVGYLRLVRCDRYDNPIYSLVGTRTDYSETADEPIGYCSGGRLQPD
jgi:hypothetical protein